MKTVVLRFAAAAVLSTAVFQAVALEHAPASQKAHLSAVKPGPAIPPPFCPLPHACGPEVR